MQIVLLADRIHTGEPFLSSLDELGWEYVFRAPDDTYVETPKHGWKMLKSVYKRRNTGRFLSNVRVWKGNQRRANISIYKYARKGFRSTTWYVISSLPACKEHFAEYACRWWQECTFKDLKSALFEWERGRVIRAERVEVLLIGVSCAIWAMWLLGRLYEHIPQRKAENIVHNSDVRVFSSKASQLLFKQPNTSNYWSYHLCLHRVFLITSVNLCFHHEHVMH